MQLCIAHAVKQNVHLIDCLEPINPCPQAILADSVVMHSAPYRSRSNSDARLNRFYFSLNDGLTYFLYESVISIHIFFIHNLSNA